MKNVVLEGAIELLDRFIMDNDKILVDGNKIQEAWNVVKRYIGAKVGLEESKPVNNYEYLRSLPLEELGVFLALDSGKRSCDPEDWYRQIHPTIEWLSENTEFGPDELTEIAEKYNCQYPSTSEYEGFTYEDLVVAKEKEGTIIDG